MGLNSEYAMPRHLIFDLETAGIDDAATYLPPSEAPANYKDEAKIAAFIAEADAAALSKAALDPDLARIVALGVCDPATDALSVHLAKTEREERELLRDFWRIVAGRVTLVGYNILEFDLRMLFRRSLYLNVPAPAIQIDKYRHPTVVDLMQILSYGDRSKYRTLEFYLHRMSIEHDHSIGGAEIPGLVAAGEWSKVESHCRADVLGTVKLARRMGILQPVAESAVA